jgi:hypothetical protein
MSSSAVREILGMFRCLIVHYHFHKSKPFSSYPELDQSKLCLSNWCLEILYCIVLKLRTWAIKVSGTCSSDRLTFLGTVSQVAGFILGPYEEINCELYGYYPVTVSYTVTVL